MKTSEVRWAVIGGGMLGLTLAHRLAQAGHRVTLYEAAPELGGLAAAWQIGEVVWDRYYHVTMLSDARTRAILDELGLDAGARWVTTRTGFYAEGRLSSMSNALEYLRLPSLSLVDKARLAGTIVWGARARNWRALEQVPVTQWLGRLSGRRVVERLWVPLLRAKLGDSYPDASAAFMWATIQRLYAARRSGLKRELFGYVPGGYARVLDAFGERLATEGVDIRLGAKVLDVGGREGQGAWVRTPEGEDRHDHVVLTVAPPVAASLIGGLTGRERDALSAIRYQGVVCASLLLRRPLAGYYLTYITEPDVPFTAVVEMSSLVGPEELGGRHLVYLPKYVGPDDPLFDATDDEVRARFEPYLAKMFPSFQPDDVEAFRVSRVRHVFPVPTLGFSRRLPPLDTTVPGVHVVSSANIVNGTLNVNETVALAERTARQLLWRSVPTGGPS